MLPFLPLFGRQLGLQSGLYLIQIIVI